VSQIPKIKSEKGTGTWNASRMTTFQGQSAKRCWSGWNAQHDVRTTRKLNGHLDL